MMVEKGGAGVPGRERGSWNGCSSEWTTGEYLFRQNIIIVVILNWVLMLISLACSSERRNHTECDGYLLKLLAPVLVRALKQDDFILLYTFFSFRASNLNTICFTEKEI